MEDNGFLIKLLAQNNYIMYNKELARKIGVESTILLGALCSYCKFYKNEEFYRNEEEIANDTTLSIYAIRKAKVKLQELGILEIAKKGLPARHFFKLNAEIIAKIIVQDTENSGNELASSSSNENVSASGNEFITTGSDEIITTINNKYNNKEYNKENNKKETYNQDTYSYIEGLFGITLGSTNYEDISSWLSVFDEEVIKYATDKCVEKGKRNLSYLYGILKVWRGNGYKTILDIKDSENNKIDTRFIPEGLL